ncbi:unnamed protein product [Rodentolepis nana]|uniref:Sec16_C domain-containing protein n=1 Tax=Rodentolepis nana TaxID=102285 RepID=A0A0R3T2U8_RODNA|nr:unnamed protein product [Rodentolepis nana]
MNHGGDFQNSPTHLQGSILQSGSPIDSIPHESNPPQDPFALIDLAAPDPPQNVSYAQKPGDPSLSSKSFAEDLVGLQPSSVDLSKSATNKRNSAEPVSLLPSQTRSLGRNKRGGNRFDEFSHNRCSTPESIVSEIQRAQAMVDPLPVDPYTQWYQLMQNYYRQFYPGCEFGNPPGRSHVQRSQRHVPISAVTLTQTPGQAVKQQQVQQHFQPPFNFPGWPQMPIQGRLGLPGGQITNPSQMQMPGFGQASDYPAYYYQYYLGALAAANGFPFPTGRTTPKVLPNRPKDGEPGRVELLDISQLASNVVAEITNRLSAVSMTSRGNKTAAHHQQHFSSSYINTNEDDLDSRIGEDELAEEEEEEEYIGLVNAWDRTDHVLYPGPLCLGATLKHDVQAFLRGKVEDIQDRMPIDWDSASLLLSYLELLIKNNGVVHPGDVVNLLMGSDSSRFVYDYPPSNNISSVSPFPTLANRVTRQSSFNVTPITAMGGGSGGLYLDSNSGRESPRVALTHSASMRAFQQQPESGRASVAGSSTGGMSISRMMRKGLLAEYGNAQERDAAALQRFRELLMHGHPLKALDQACQTQLWGHAFALAMRLGSGPLDRVMEKFLSRAVNPSDPLLTLYQLTAGEIPRSVDQLAYTGGTDTGDWRPHLAMLLSAPEGHGDLARDSLERMGESLLARRLLFAAHLCFLLAANYSNQGTTATPHLPPRIWLLGISAPSNSSEECSGRFVITSEVERAPTEAIQLTEIYEFALALATRDKHFFLPNFLPFKFAYCLRLVDAGLIEKAFRYLEMLSDSVSNLVQELEESDMSPIDLRALYLIASQCLRLSERLQHHPEVGSFEMEGVSRCHVLRESSAPPCPQWIERLRGVCQRISSLLGLPNSDRPYVDPLRVSPSEEPSDQDPPQDQRPTQQQQQQQQVPQIRKTVFPTVQQHQQSHLQHQRNLPAQPNQPPQQQQIIHQSPHAHQVQQQPKKIATLENTHLPRQQCQPAVHDDAPSPPQTSSSTSPQEQQQIRMPLEVPNAPPSPQQPQQNQLLGQSLAPIPPSSTPTVRMENSQVPLRSPVTAANNNLPFFVPTFNPSSEPIVEPVTNSETSASGYDYFAGLARPPQPISRSRTVSMTSSQDDSTPHLSSPSPTDPSSTSPVPHQVPQVPDQISRRSSGIVQQPPTNSSGYLKFNQEQCGRPKAYKRPHNRIIFQGGNYDNNSSDGERIPTPRLSFEFSQKSLLRDNRIRNVQKDTKINHAPPFTTAPPHPPVSSDNDCKSNGQTQQPQQQSPSEIQEEEKKGDDSGGQSGKSGWLSGLLGRIKGGQEVYLPDDSNPTIVWDEATGRWRDKLGGDQEDDTPPPPPQMPTVPSMSQNSTPVGHPGVQPPLRTLATGGGGSSISSGGAISRSRYVNVLGKQGVSSGPKAVQLTPPLPTTFLPPS